MKTRIDAVSLLILQQTLLAGTTEGILSEPPAPYGAGEWAEQVALLEAEELVRLYRTVRGRMDELGIPPEAAECGAGAVGPEVLRITSRYRIFLPERGGEELRLRPLVKTVFIFFLKHPEGVLCKEVGRYRAELLAIYSRITGREDPAAVAATVDRLVDVMDNSFHENCSRLNTRLAETFPPPVSDQYQVHGTRAGLRRIALERMYVRWEPDGQPSAPADDTAAPSDDTAARADDTAARADDLAAPAADPACCAGSLAQTI